MRADFSLRALCENLEVSPSGFYAWCRRRICPCGRVLADQLLAREVVELHAQSRRTYGSPRLVEELRKRGHRHGRKRISRIMLQKGIYGRQKARYRVHTTDSNHDQPVAPNRLAGAPSPSGPNQIWVSDITYVQTSEGWLYLAALLDLYSRKIVGWAMSEHIDSPLVLKALSMAVTHRNPPPNLICHSDRGVQYASADYRQALAHAGLVPSMSRRANCYDNASMESFWSTLKLELVYRSSFPTRSFAKSQIFNYIESFYNRSRAHSALNFLSPAQFESLTN